MLEIHHITEIESWVDGVDAVIFDLDDTLYSEKDYVRSGYAAVAAAFPQISDMAHRLWLAFEAGGQAIDQVLAEEGMATEEQKQYALKIYRFHRPSIKLFDGTKEMLERQVGS